MDATSAMTTDLSEDDLRLVRWLIAGHQNERDDDVQRLFRKCGRILESKKKHIGEELKDATML